MPMSDHAKAHAAPFLSRLLRGMKDGIGKVFTPNVHPSGAHEPTCKRAFLFAKRLGWYKPRWSEALYAGTAMHEVLSRTYQGTEIDIASEQIRSEANLSIAKSQASYEADNPGEKAPDYDEVKKAASLGTVMASAYDHAFPMPTSWDVIAVEQTIQRELSPVLGVSAPPLVGTMDLVIHDPTNPVGPYWLLDYKSCSEKPSYRATGLTYAIQPRLYRALWNAAHPDKKLAGVIHGIVQKPTIRRKTKSGETWPQYYDRCLQWYEDQMLTNPDDPPIIRSRIAFLTPPLEKDLELHELLRKLAALSVPNPDLSTFYRCGNHHVCVDARFRRVCPYFPFCSAEDPRRWENIFETRGFLKRDPEIRD